MEGSITSSIEYSKANEGKATKTKISEGTRVQIISIVVPWTTWREGRASIVIWSCGLLKKNRVRARTTKTNQKIKVIKNIKSWCKFIIPSITGLAASWKKTCQGREESNKNINVDDRGWTYDFLIFNQTLSPAELHRFSNWIWTNNRMVNNHTLDRLSYRKRYYHIEPRKPNSILALIKERNLNRVSRCLEEKVFSGLPETKQRLLNLFCDI